MADVNKKSEEAWNVYRMDSDFMVPRYTFRDGYSKGWSACEENMLRVLRDVLSAEQFNEIKELFDNQE